MMKVPKAVVIAITAAAILQGFGEPAASFQTSSSQTASSQTSSPQTYYDKDDKGDKDDDRHRHYGCREMITATGIGYPFGIGSRQSAIKAWKREAWTLYGSDFSWDRAATQNIECLPYLATIRCVASARPCT
jgi:hypothetical protein